MSEWGDVPVQIRVEIPRHELLGASSEHEATEVAALLLKEAGIPAFVCLDWGDPQITVAYGTLFTEVDHSEWSTLYHWKST